MQICDSMRSNEGVRFCFCRQVGHSERCRRIQLQKRTPSDKDASCFRYAQRHIQPDRSSLSNGVPMKRKFREIYWWKGCAFLGTGSVVKPLHHYCVSPKPHLSSLSFSLLSLLSLNLSYFSHTSCGLQITSVCVHCVHEGKFFF